MSVFCTVQRVEVSSSVQIEFKMKDVILYGDHLTLWIPKDLAFGSESDWDLANVSFGCVKKNRRKIVL